MPRAGRDAPTAPVRGWRHERADVGDLAFGLRTSPSANGSSAFVLVHGVGTSHRSLARLARLLARHGRVVILDMPGHAGLPRPDRLVDVEGMSDALAEVLDRIDVQGATLVGHSMGAQWVVELAARRPDLAASVVAIGPVADVARRGPGAHLAALVHDTLLEPPGTNAIVLGDYVRCGAAWYAAQARHMLAYPIESRVGALTVPLLVVRGSRDPIARRSWCRLLRTRAARARIVEIPGRAHVAQHTAPRAVAAAILAAARRS